MNERGIGTVIVTGGASGLGAAVAHAVAEAGGSPVVFDVRPSRDGIAHETVDIGDREATEAAVQRVAEQTGGLDAVVTSAGTDSCGRLDEVDGAEWDRVIRVNLCGTAAVVRAALPHLKKSRGRVVTVASTLGLRALPDATAYCASKFGIVGFTRALSKEVAGEVGVTCLIPGGMSTAFFDGRIEKYKPAPDAPLNRPEDVAQAAIFALRQPWGCEVREILVTPSLETSWP
ncbi:MAG TPA: SDR family oxidoreductase [Candidatus Sulfotelmatobacter sp.]|jgi:NAD(P)-dependent dehydrogenase (short-subunit alcohol dehydrogenase family)|nr:SDR family oxidoreductase [Candidatus Sulfotelmatobacter sp.]